MLGRLARLAWLGVIVAQSACASRLDFDSVSAGWDAAREHDAATEASTPVEADARDASVDDARDASVDDAGRAPRGELPRDAAPPEAGNSAVSDAGSMDGAASPDEAGTPSSGSDAAVGATTFSCAQEPAFIVCHEFESSAELDRRLIVEPFEPAPAGSVSIDNRAGSAGQSSLLAVVNPAVPACATCDLKVFARWLFWEFQEPQRLSIEFDMRIEDVDVHADHRATLFRFTFGTPERGIIEHTLQLQGTGENVQAAFVEEDTAEQLAGSTAPPEKEAFNYGWKPAPLYNWVHVKYLLDAVNSDGSGNAAQLQMGTQELFNDKLFYGLRYREPTLQLGVPVVYTSYLAAGETNAGWRVRYDNLVVRRLER